MRGLEQGEGFTLMQDGGAANERVARSTLVSLLHSTPIPDGEIGTNLGLYANRLNLSRILFADELYRMILGVHGSIIEFGVRWGQNLALFHNLRGIHEPHNLSRRIIGFDTFAGFPAVSDEDGVASVPGAYAVTEGYAEHLAQVLACHEQMSPIAHQRRFELVEGDATETTPAWLAEHPEAVIALAYFDFDIYPPTKACLEAIRPHLTKGSVIVFDELAHATFPGETIAVREVLGLDRYAIRHSRYDANAAYLVIE